MRVRKCPVLVEMSERRQPSGLSISQAAEPVDVALALRAAGLAPYRVYFDPDLKAWVAKVIDWAA